MASAAGLGLLFKADTSQAESAIAKIVGGLGSIGLAGMGVGVVKDTIGSVVGSVNDLITSSEALGDAGARVGAVWGSEMQGVIEDNATIANSLGLTKTAYLDQVGALGQLATSLGVGGDAAADMAMGITELAPKLAAYAGVEGSVASDALEKALQGKTKGLAALGIAITDADTKQAALALGIKGQANKWTEAQTAQVMYAAAMAKTGAAQELWAGNSKDVGQQLLNITATIDDAKAAIGDRLLPVVAPLVEMFAGALPGAIDTAMGLFDQLTGKGSLVGDALAAASSAIPSLMDAFDALTSSDPGEALDFLAVALSDLTGIDVSSWVTPIQEGLAALRSKVDEVRDAISPWIAKFDELIGIGDTAKIMLGVTLVVAFGLLAAAAWSAAAGVVAAMAPILIPIAAIGLAVAVLKAAWDNNFGGIQEKTAAVVAWLQANVLPTVQAVFDGVMGVVGGFVAFWQQNQDTIQQIVAGAWTVISGLFDAGFSLIRGIVEAALALLRGDFTGAFTAIQNGVAGALRGLGNVLHGALAVIGAELKLVISNVGPITAQIGHAIIDGLVNIIKGGAAILAGAITGVLKGLVDAAMSALQAHSPSKVFEEIGSFITLGLASGIQKEDRKAIEALAAVIGGMNNVLSGVADFSSKLLKFVVPSDTVVAEARSKFTALLLIVQSFVKDFAYLGALLPVANISGASDQQKGLIDAVVRSKFGVGVGDLITGGEASWTTALTDIITKVASAWGAIADNLTKMAAAKMPTDSQLDALKAAAVGVILWAQDVTTLAPPNPVGTEDFAAVVTAASNMLATVAKIDLSKVTMVTAAQMSVARSNVELIGSEVSDMMRGWMSISAEARTKWVEGVASFAAAVKSNADILKAGDVGDLSKQTVLTVEHTGIARSNLNVLGTMVEDLVKGWMKVASDVRDRWNEGVKSFAEAVKANLDILKASQVGEVKAEIIVNLDDVRSVLTFVRDQLVPAIRGIVDGWTVASNEAGQMTDRMQQFGGWIKAALDIAKATDIGELKTDVSVKLDYLTTILVWLRDVLAPSMEGIAAGWVRSEEAAKQATDHMKQFADWIKVAVDIAKATEVGDLKSGISVQTDYLEGILIWMRDSFAPLLQGIALAWTPTADEAEATTKRMKLFADWVKVAVDIAKVTEVGDLKANILVNMTYLEGILVWMRDTFVPTIQGVVAGWGMATDEAKDLVARMNLFASILKAASDIAKAASDNMDLSGVTGGDLAAKGAALKAYVLMVFDVLKDVASTITTEEAQARALLATAAGTAATGLADVGDSIGKIMAMATGGLFGADPNRGDLGFMQRVKGRRADFNASVLTDSIKRMVASLTAALADMNLPDPKDPKIAALAALGDAFAKLAEGVTKLAEAKLPDAKRLAELAALASNGGGLFPTTALATAGAGAGGGGVAQVNNYTLNGDVVVNPPNGETAEGIVTGLGVWRRRP